MRFMRCLIDVGAYLEKSQQPELAIKLYENGLEIDDLSENIYLRLMRCYHALGRYAEAIKIYQRCSGVLRAHFGLKPPREMLALYESLAKCA